MKLQFSVHSPHRSTIAQSVIYRGEEGRATMDCFEAELVALDGASGMLKLRLLGSDIAAGETLFKNDAIMDVEFTDTGTVIDATGAPPAKKAA
jgi:hypothetical protein